MTTQAAPTDARRVAEEIGHKFFPAEPDMAKHLADSSERALIEYGNGRLEEAAKAVEALIKIGPEYTAHYELAARPIRALKEKASP
jgi:hypothetical protein